MNSRGLPSKRGQIFGEDLSGSDGFVAPAASEVALGGVFRDGGAPRYAETVLATVPPERRVGAWKRRLLPSIRLPNALHRVASPQPRCDLLFALHKICVRLALWSLRRPIIEFGKFLIHEPVIGFGDPKYSQMGRFF